jgi:hypothetical protein
MSKPVYLAGLVACWFMLQDGNDVITRQKTVFAARFAQSLHARRRGKCCAGLAAVSGEDVEVVLSCDSIWTP